jgi:hypothetical protein
MMALLDRLGARTGGIILLVVAAVLGLLAAWIAYGAINRWQTASSLEDWRLDLLARDDSAAHQDAQDAAATRGDAAAVLPSIDLASEADAQLLETLAARVPARQREAVRTVAALAAARRGATAASAPGTDGVLIAHLQRLGKDGPPPALELGHDDPPHLATLAVVLARQFQAAWAAGAVDAIRQAAGPLLLLDPRRKEAPALRLILAATDSGYPGPQLAQLITAIPEQGERLALVRQLCRLSSAHTLDLVKAIPPDKATAEEQQRGLLGSESQLEPLVKKALATPSEPVSEALIPRCLAEGRGDLARQLIALLRADRKPPFELALASAEGDLAAVARLAGDKPELAPRISPPVFADGQFAFHLSTTSGLIPRTPVEVRVKGQPVPAGRIQRFASLVLVHATLAAGDAYEVRLGDRVIGSGVGP